MTDLAPVPRRIGAALLDGLFFAAVFIFPTTLRVADSANAGEPVEPSAAWVAVSTLVALTYGIAPIALWGRTLGKHLLGVQVVTADAGALPGFRVAAIRYLVFSLFPLALVLPELPGQIISALWTGILLATMVSDPQNRGLHDRAAGTLVVMRARGGATDGA